MAVFVPRTTAPSVENEYYKHVTYGGLNECILINYSTGSIMPNCVGYAWGRAYELLKYRPALVRTDARTWYPSYEGYSRGQVPQLGAIACWAGTQYGHVAVVESIGPDYIMVSQSGWNEFYWEYAKLPKQADGSYYTNRGQRGFQGFIYLPEAWQAVGSGTTIPSPYATVDEIARAIIRGTGEWYRCNGYARQKKVEAYGFNYREVQNRVNQILRGW